MVCAEGQPSSCTQHRSGEGLGYCFFVSFASKALMLPSPLQFPGDGHSRSVVLDSARLEFDTNHPEIERDKKQSGVRYTKRVQKAVSTCLLYELYQHDVHHLSRIPRRENHGGNSPRASRYQRASGMARLDWSHAKLLPCMGPGSVTRFDSCRIAPPLHIVGPGGAIRNVTL